ncbi:UPF0149 family protein [Marichromatium gracile]|uniref:UPF0149 family protein n=1 Tax=Marichromatium gracile TaxID=1048 RepID=UPI001F168665|nr:UPF0149 family protein [Marichromatium gracile]MCF1183359.1 UPF0149 family protein [Marichromatium gracile]
MSIHRDERAPCATEVATDIDDTRLDQLLEASPLTPTASEAHGMLCGLICAGITDPEQRWLDQLLPASSPQADAGQSEAAPPEAETDPVDSEEAEAAREETRAALGELARATRAALADEDYGFSPLLPDEGAPLAQRATALYDWVRGFLYAFGMLGISEQGLSEQGREILRDFADITRMDLNDLDDNEENEAALTEIIEFTRAAALLIHDEAPARQDSDKGQGTA